MLLLLIFNVLLNNVTHGHTDGHTTLPLLGLLSEPKIKNIYSVKTDSSSEPVLGNATAISSNNSVVLKLYVPRDYFHLFFTLQFVGMCRFDTVDT